jgi:hypothetical protein
VRRGGAAPETVAAAAAQGRQLCINIGSALGIADAQLMRNAVVRLPAF